MSIMEFDGIRHKLLPETIPKQKTEPFLPIPSLFIFRWKQLCFAFFSDFLYMWY